MDLLGLLAAGAVIFIGLKLFLKTLKMISMLTIVALVMGAIWLWQHGMLPFK